MTPHPYLVPPLQAAGTPLHPLQGESRDGVDSSAVWIRICEIDEIPRLGARVVRRASGPNVAIFRTGDDKLFALADRCPHRGGPLSQGIVFGERVACPLHNTCVELDSGCAVAPDKGRVQRYPVRIDGGVVYVELEVHVQSQISPPHIDPPVSPRERGRG
jgi:nitrite reductase (NADH) small subunit